MPNLQDQDATPGTLSRVSHVELGDVGLQAKDVTEAGAASVRVVDDAHAASYAAHL